MNLKYSMAITCIQIQKSKAYVNCENIFKMHNVYQSLGTCGLKRECGFKSCSKHRHPCYVYLSNIPAIATENLLVLLLFSLFTTCFGSYGPSSGEMQLHHLHILKKPSILQWIHCFTIAHSYGVSLLLSTL
jgi:hypothetical protein